ncbi:MAG: IS1380 family transposase [Mariprofundaceae bacterium]
MAKTTTEQLRFPTIASMSVRADFDGGAMSSDFGALLIAGVDRQIGLTQRLSEAFSDMRHRSYVTHPMQDLIKQRVYQQASGYEDCNDSNDLRSDPMFKLAVGRKPLEEENDLASQPTFSRLENAATSKDIYRMSRAMVDQFIASYAKAPKLIILDMDHTSDRTYGQQEFSFYNHHYRSYCYLPLTIFEGGSGKLVAAILRPGKRPTGKENAMIMKRILKQLRQAWPRTHIILRGDGHFSNPELMQLCLDGEHMDFIFGLPSNKKLAPMARPLLDEARALHAYRSSLLKKNKVPAKSTRLFAEYKYAAGSWPQAFRTILKAEVMDAGVNPRFIVTSITDLSPETAYKKLYCDRGNDERYIKELKLDLACDRTSNSTFVANYMRLMISCAAYTLIHTLRSETLRATGMAKASASTIILKLFKIAVRLVQYKDRIKLHLPSSCPAKALLLQVTEILYKTPPPKLA